jgi:hypothetical protein
MRHTVVTTRKIRRFSDRLRSLNLGLMDLGNLASYTRRLIPSVRYQIPYRRNHV